MLDGQVPVPRPLAARRKFVCPYTTAGCRRRPVMFPATPPFCLPDPSEQHMTTRLQRLPFCSGLVGNANEPAGILELRIEGG